jgi:hypothetical protein
MDLTTLVSDANSYIDTLRTGNAQLVDIANQKATIAGETALLQSQVGVNQGIVSNASADAEMAQQRAKQLAGSIFGTDLSVNAKAIQDLADMANTASAQKIEALKEIQAKKSISPGDDPIGWLAAQFTVVSDIKKHNAADAIESAAYEKIQKLNSASRELAITQEQFKAPITIASRDAYAANLVKLANVQANQSFIQGLTFNAEGVKAALDTPKEQIAMEFQINAARMAERHIEIAQAHLDFARKQAEEKAKEKDMDESLLLQSMNAGVTLRMGSNNLQYTAKDLTLIKAGLNSKTPNQYQADFNSGLEYMMTGTARLAANPGEAYVLLNNGVRMNLPSGMDPLKAIIGKAGDDTLSGKAVNPDGSLVDVKNPEAVKRAISQRANKLLNDSARDIKPGTGNPFEIPEIRGLIASSPTVQELAITQKLLNPLITAGADLSTPDKVFAAVVNGVDSKRITYEEALELTTIYGVGVKANLEHRQLTKLGFSPPGDGSWFGYRSSVQIDPYAVFNKNEVIDFTKPDSLGRAMNTHLARKVAAELLTPKVPNIQRSDLQFGPKLTYPPPASEQNFSYPPILGGQ